MYSKAKDGKSVARLKNGDPMIFARGGEELEYLQEKKIEVEIVPGLSSAISIPSLNKIPLTKRGVSSSLSILAGYGAGGKEPQWTGVGATAVVLMPVGNLSLVVEKLITSGKSANTLSALISSGSTEEEQLLISPLSSIVELAKVTGIESPSILVAGNVVNELLNIKGKTVAAFRPSNELERTRRLVEKAGGIPLIFEICDVEFSEYPKLKKALAKDWDYLVFMSPNGVRSASNLIDLTKFKTIAVGNRTKTKLEEHGCKKVIVPEQQSSAGVEELLKEKRGSALALRSPLAKEEIKGAENVTTYSIKLKNLSPIIDEYLSKKVDFTLLTSAGLLELLLESAKEKGKKARLTEKLNDSFVISIGRKTTEFTLTNDIWVNYELSKPSLESLFQRSVNE
ncbi:hypothetical protein AKJ42_03160 [candidate division MSBL1 archaeon SCGC-AAA261C02]|uniref:Tetrapyrrole biosynthesis uroporphyrinogen III synthase domain-containing protein n=1 Tax=candidate division MSBL1 archaeon SCGC-AAA261C02 TaxID=1698272 RepID=A0A133UZ33_9EURY|nr:hypothetical protein AKJ42_03160 [candidate division MSBL1 archaeon SCGC-AAA261C02]